MATDPFPLQITPKEDSPELIAALHQFGESAYTNSSDFAIIIQALNYLYENTGSDPVTVPNLTQVLTQGGRTFKTATNGYQLILEDKTKVLVTPGISSIVLNNNFFVDGDEIQILNPDSTNLMLTAPKDTDIGNQLIAINNIALNYNNAITSFAIPIPKGLSTLKCIGSGLYYLITKETLNGSNILATNPSTLAQEPIDDILAGTSFTADTPVDADTIAFSDLSDSNKAKKVSFSNFYTYLKGKFDSVYATITQLNSKANLVVQVTPITLSVGSWSLVSGLYEYNYTNASIFSTSLVDVIPSNSTIDIVKTAQILPKTVSITGSVKLYSTNLPTADIIVTINIFN